MEIKAIDYEAKDIIKIIREWTELTQPEFAKTIKRTDRTLQAYESGETNYTVKMLLDIAKKHKIEIIIKKK